MALRLPARAAPLVHAFLLTGFMTVVVAGISTLVAVGFGAPMLVKWLQAWILSWAVAFPTILVVMPVVRRIVAALVGPPPTASPAAEAARSHRG